MYVQVNNRSNNRGIFVFYFLNMLKVIAKRNAGIFEYEVVYSYVLFISLSYLLS